MALSENSELRLKRAIRSGKIEELLKETTMQIQESEKELNQLFSSYYSDLISKCGYLEELKDLGYEIQMKNFELKNAIELDCATRIAYENESKELQEALKNIEILQNDIKKIENCLTKSNELISILERIKTDKKKDDDLYLLVFNILFLRKNSKYKGI